MAIIIINTIGTIAITLGAVDAADQLERINMIYSNTSIEDWMEK